MKTGLNTQYVKIYLICYKGRAYQALLMIRQEAADMVLTTYEA